MNPSTDKATAKLFADTIANEEQDPKPMGCDYTCFISVGRKPSNSDGFAATQGTTPEMATERAALIVQAVNEREALLAIAEAAKEFVAKCDLGEARSKRSYAAFKDGLKQLSAIRKEGA